MANLISFSFFLPTQNAPPSCLIFMAIYSQNMECMAACMIGKARFSIGAWTNRGLCGAGRAVTKAWLWLTCTLEKWQEHGGCMAACKAEAVGRARGWSVRVWRWSGSARNEQWGWPDCASGCRGMTYWHEVATAWCRWLETHGKGKLDVVSVSKARGGSAKWMGVRIMLHG